MYIPAVFHMLVLMHASALWTAKADSGTKLENEVNTRLGCVLEYYNMCNIYIYIYVGQSFSFFLSSVTLHTVFVQYCTKQ